jgi:hypothetical protein
MPMRQYVTANAEEKTNRLLDGSIDYQFYADRARILRSREAVASFRSALRVLFAIPRQGAFRHKG